MSTRKGKKRKKGPKANALVSQKRQPIPGAQVEARKRPIPGAPVEDNMTVVWRFSMLDLVGPWGWSNLAPSDVAELHAKLMGWESMRASEVFKSTQKGGNKLIPLENLCADAQDRLIELQLDDQDALWELRVAGPKRIWGFRRANVFYLLWWDPEHTVCPSNKRS